MPSVGRLRTGEGGLECSLTEGLKVAVKLEVFRLTAFDPDDYLKVISKVLAEVLVESPQEDVHLE